MTQLLESLITLRKREIASIDDNDYHNKDDDDDDHNNDDDDDDHINGDDDDHNNDGDDDEEGSPCATRKL